VLFDYYGGDEPFDRGVVGEHADDVGAALQLMVQSLERIGRSDLAPVRSDRKNSAQRASSSVSAGRAAQHLTFGSM